MPIDGLTDGKTDRRIRVTRCVPSAGAYKYPSRNNVDLYKLYLVKSSFVVFGGKKMAQLYHPDRRQSQDWLFVWLVDIYYNVHNKCTLHTFSIFNIVLMYSLVVVTHLLAHGNNIPRVKSPSKGPPRRPYIVIVAWKYKQFHNKCSKNPFQLQCCVM